MSRPGKSGMNEPDASSLGPDSLAPKRLLVCMGLVLLVTCAAYLPVLDNQFTNWDDPQYVLENRLIRSLDGTSLGRIFSTYVLGNYHPLTILSYALEYQIGQLDPFLYHLDNLLLHLANTALVFCLARLLFAHWLAALVAALLFGLHPQNVESVAWISERKGLLSACGFLGALVCYASYLKHGCLDGFRNGWLKAALLLYSCSLLSKGTTVPLPVVLLLMDWHSGRPWLRKALFEKVPFFLLSFLFGFLALYSQAAAQAIKTSGYSLVTSFCSANLALLTYLQRLLLPIGQACFHPYPKLETLTSQVVFYGSPLLVLLLCALLLFSLRKTRLLLFGSLFFLLTVALVLQLLPVGDAITADRYTYLPYVGLFLVVGRGAALLYTRRPGLRLALWGALLLLCGALSVLTWRRCQVWENTVTLWTDVIAKQPRNPMAYNSRGEYHFRVGDHENALRDFERALQIAPRFRDGYNNRGAIHQIRGELYQALADYDRSIELKPDDPVTYLNRGMVQHDLGRFEGAVSDLTIAIERMGGDGQALHFRSLAFFQLGQYREALQDALAARRQGRQIPDDYLEDLKSR